MDREYLNKLARSKGWDNLVELVTEMRDAEIRRWLGSKPIDEVLRGRAQAFEQLRRELVSYKNDLEDEDVRE